MSLQGLDLQKVDGTAVPAESFNRNLDFYTVTVANVTFDTDGTGSPALDSAGVPVAAGQYLFNKMIEVISLKAQPILLSVTGGSGTGKSAFTFVTEHSQLWSESGNAAAETLKTVLDAEIQALLNDADAQLYATFVATITYASYVGLGT